MKIPKSLLLGFTTSAIALTANPGFSESTPNSSPGFHCDTIKNVLTTFAVPDSDSPQKDIMPLIEWKEKYIEGDLSASCQKAAGILNDRYNQEKPGVLAFDSSKLPTAVCIVAQEGHSCRDSGEELFTFKKKINTKDDLYNALVATIKPDFAEIDQATIKEPSKGRDVTSARMKRRNLWEIIFRKPYLG